MTEAQKRVIRFCSYGSVWLTCTGLPALFILHITLGIIFMSDDCMNE